MLSSHYQMEYRIDFVVIEIYLFYLISLSEKVWRSYADLNPSRARTLVICTYNGDDLEIYGKCLINLGFSYRYLYL